MVHPLTVVGELRCVALSFKSVCLKYISSCVFVCTDKYFPFVCDVIIRLLLAQDSYQTSQSTACHLLTLSDQWQSR